MIRLHNPTGRNTPAHVVDLGSLEFFFSYETCIAFRGPMGSMRITNNWGPTTGRHFRELGCQHFPTVDQDVFDRAVTLATDAIELAARTLATVDTEVRA